MAGDAGEDDDENCIVEGRNGGDGITDDHSSAKRLTTRMCQTAGYPFAERLSIMGVN